MFTGIVSDIGTITASDQRGDLHLTISCGYAMEDVAIGASIACSGTCLTVVDKGTDTDGTGWFSVDASAETLSRTAPGMWAQGRTLNLERALRLGEELGGHIVTGHVDGVGHVVSVREEGESHHVILSVGPEIAPFIAAKGSVTVNGVSLTVNTVLDQGADAHFSLNIIPHTWDVTTLSQVQPGMAVNIEIDVLARYLSRLKDRMAAA